MVFQRDGINDSGLDAQVAAGKSATVIYLIQAGDTGPVKIGVATNANERLRALQVSNADRLILVRQIPGGRAQERWLHERFADLRIRGEWFVFSNEMLSAEPPEIADDDAVCIEDDSERAPTEFETAARAAEAGIALVKALRKSNPAKALQVLDAVGEAINRANAALDAEMIRDALKQFPDLRRFLVPPALAADDDPEIGR